MQNEELLFQSSVGLALCSDHCASRFGLARDSQGKRKIVASRITDALVIDGELDESVWQDAVTSGKFA